MSLENNKFVDKFTMVAVKLGNQIHLRSLRDAFATVMPLYILAGLAVLLNNTVFTWIFSGDTLANVQYWGTTITNATLNISGLLIAAIIGYCLARNRDFENPLAASMISMACLIAMMPNTVSVTPNAAKAAVEVSGVLPFANLGTGSMFAGVIVALLATEAFIQEPLRHIGTGLWGCIILYSLGNMLWLFGIHQSVIYSSILEPLLIINITENIAAYSAGQAIPNIINVSQVTTYGLMGGSGSTICLLIATFLVGKNAMTKNVAKMSAAPGIFNINEPVIFGYPIVYNITMAIPFVLVPALGILISYIATATGFMSPCVSLVPWTTPPLLSSFLATAGDLKAVLVQAIVLVLGVLIYIPFVKINDRVLEKQAAMENEGEE